MDPDERIIKALEESAELYGLSPSHGRIYGRLYLSGEPMTLDDLSEKTGFAKSTVSNAMHEFENMKFVERDPSKDSTRTVYFQAREDFETVFQELVTGKFQEEIEIMLEAIETAKQDMDSETEKYERVENLEEVYRRGRLFISVLERLGLSRVADLVEKLPGVSGRNS